MERVCRKYGFQKVSCPSLADISLFETSGHAQKFNEELFRVESPKGHKFVLKQKLQINFNLCFKPFSISISCLIILIINIILPLG